MKCDLMLSRLQHISITKIYNNLIITNKNLKEMKKALKNVFSWIGLSLLAIVVFPAMVVHSAYQVWYFKNYLLNGRFTRERENEIERKLQKLTKKSH